MARRAAPLLILALGTTGFGLAMAARSVANPWWTNAAAGAFALLASGAVLEGRLAELFGLRTKALAGSVLLGGAMVGATHLGYAAATEVVPGLSQAVARLYGDIGRDAPPPAITWLLILLVVAAEEVLWRGLAIEILQRRVGTLATGVAAVSLYALPQLVAGTWVLVVLAVAVGGVFTAQRLASGRVADPFVTHAIWSLCVFSLVPLGPY